MKKSQTRNLLTLSGSLPATPLEVLDQDPLVKV